MGLRLNPPPGWPPMPEGFTPQPGWQPDPSWPPAPPGWQLWIDDGQQQSAAPTVTVPPPPGQYPSPGSNPPPAGATPPPGGYQAPGPYQASSAYQAPGAFQAPGTPPPGGPGGYPGYAGYQPSVPSVGRRIRRGVLAVRLVIGGVVLVVAVVVLIVTHLNGASRSSSSGQITKSGNLTVSDLQVGDCFDNPSDAMSNGVDTVKAIPCSQAHDSQIFAKFSLPAGAFPGDSAVQDQASKGCDDHTVSLNKSKVTDSMEVRFLVPEVDGWDQGDRGVSCLILNPTPTITTSLLNG